MVSNSIVYLRKVNSNSSFITYSIDFVLDRTFFMDWTLLGNYKSKQTFCIHQFTKESSRDSINRMNDGQANY